MLSLFWFWIQRPQRSVLSIAADLVEPQSGRRGTAIVCIMAGCVTVAWAVTIFALSLNGAFLVRGITQFAVSAACCYVCTRNSLRYSVS